MSLNASPSDAIVIRGVTKRFGQKPAVHNLDLTVPAGAICGFLGPNGAGKTTTIRMIMGIILPDEGEISVLGHHSALDSRARVGYLPEERGVYRTMKVGDFLTYMAKLKGMDTRGLAAKIDQWLERLALPGVRKKKCQELSKGMQQKVQFAATILHDPELIILDEPFSGLDPVNARILRELILEQHQMGKTIVFSTHVLFSAEQLCDRVFMINKGRKILDGTIQQIRERFDPKTVVAELAPDSPDEPGALDRVRGVASVSRTKPRVYELRLEGADPQSVMRDAAALPGLRLRRVEQRAATLEDVFISLVDPADSEDMARESAQAHNEPQEVGADA